MRFVLSRIWIPNDRVRFWSPYQFMFQPLECAQEYMYMIKNLFLELSWMVWWLLAFAPPYTCRWCRSGELLASSESISRLRIVSKLKWTRISKTRKLWAIKSAQMSPEGPRVKIKLFLLFDAFGSDKFVDGTWTRARLRSNFSVYPLW